MPTTLSRSSKEWSASALEKDRKAKEQAVRQQQIAAQLAALQAQYEAGQEEEKHINEQAAIDRQNAKNQEFYEISLFQQEVFRAMIADDTYTRVAQTLVDNNEFNYVNAIGEGQLDSKSSPELKAMLWEAIAGNDPTFLQQAAQRIAHRYQRHITDEDISAVRDSVACLSPNFVSPIQPQAKDTCDDQIETNATEALKASIPGFLSESSELLHQVVASHEADNPRVSPPTTTTKQGIEETADIKLEALERGPNQENLMDVIEQDTAASAIRSVSVANDDINVQLTDPLGNIITGDELQAEGKTELIQRTPIQEAEPNTPNSTSRKRYLSEDQEEGTPTPSEAAVPSTSKKRKTSGQKSSGKILPIISDDTQSNYRL